MKNLQWQPIVGTDKQKVVGTDGLILESRETWDDGAIYQLAVGGFNKAENLLNFATEEERDEYVKENYPSIEREMLIAKAKEVVETYTHDDAEPLGHLAEMAEMLGLGKPVDYLWYMQGKAGSADFDRDAVNKMYGYYGFTEGDIDKESGNKKLSWSIDSLANNMLTSRITNVVESHGEDYIRAEDVHNLLDVLHADPAKLVQCRNLEWNLLHAAAATLGNYNEGFSALMEEMDGNFEKAIGKGLETNDNLHRTPIQIAKESVEKNKALNTYGDGVLLLYKAEEITGEYPVIPQRDNSLLHVAHNLNDEFKSGKGAMCPETFMRNHIISQNDETLRIFDYCTNVVNGTISASAISAIIGGKYDGWKGNDFAREYIKSAQELCNVASQYASPIQFDNFKRHLNETAKRFGIEQEVEQKAQENIETKTNEHTKKLGAIRTIIWNASEEMREYNYHEICDGVADYNDMIKKWKTDSNSNKLPPKLGLTFYLKDANLKPDDEPLIYDIEDKRFEFDKRITVFDAEHGYNTHMEEEIPDYATYPNKSYWKEWAFEIKKELWRRDIDENKKYGWPLGELNPNKDMFNIFAKRLKIERQKDSNKDIPIVNLGKRVYHTLSPDERKYVNNFLDSSNIHSDKAMEKLLLKAVGEPVKAKKRQRDDSRER